jgi:hypothetical protein
MSVGARVELKKKSGFFEFSRHFLCLRLIVVGKGINLTQATILKDDLWQFIGYHFGWIDYESAWCSPCE